MGQEEGRGQWREAVSLVFSSPVCGGEQTWDLGEGGARGSPRSWHHSVTTKPGVSNPRLWAVLKTRRDVFVMMCRSVFNVWPETTLLLPCGPEMPKAGTPLVSNLAPLTRNHRPPGPSWGKPPPRHTGLRWCPCCPRTPMESLPPRPPAPQTCPLLPPSLASALPMSVQH